LQDSVAYAGAPRQAPRQTAINNAVLANMEGMECMDVPTASLGETANNRFQ
jgi:hypothetical protein